MTMPSPRPCGRPARARLMGFALGALALAASSAGATTISLVPTADGDVFDNGITPPVIDTTDTVVST